MLSIKKQPRIIQTSKACKATKKEKEKKSDRANARVADLHEFFPEISYQDNKFTRIRFLLLKERLKNLSHLLQYLVTLKNIY